MGKQNWKGGDLSGDFPVTKWSCQTDTNKDSKSQLRSFVDFLQRKGQINRRNG